jgi:acyl-CoA dehydrogenase
LFGLVCLQGAARAEVAANRAAGNAWKPLESVEQLKARAKELGLWNLFLPSRPDTGGLSNLEYAPLCEIMGRSLYLAPEALNCSAPDTGNMEVLARYGNKAQQERWLAPLLRGEIRSCFGMTEPGVASSDATNIECSVSTSASSPDEYVINGRKWWTSGAMDPRCKVMILLARTDLAGTQPKHKKLSMLLVPIDAPGVTIERHLTVYGYDHAPHGHAVVRLVDVRVKKHEAMLLGEGRGFEIAQGRLGPGRIHHCMRLIGQAERALEMHVRRVLTRTAFGGTLATKGAQLKDIADSRIEIDSARQLVLQAASSMDKYGNKVAAQQIAMIKVLCAGATVWHIMVFLADHPFGCSCRYRPRWWRCV